MASYSRAAGSLSSRSRVVAEAGVSSRVRICCKVSVGVRGATVGSDNGVRVVCQDPLGGVQVGAGDAFGSDDGVRVVQDPLGGVQVGAGDGVDR